MEKGDPKALVEYLHDTEKTLAAGHATEGSHYPALKALLESFSPGLSVTLLPARIECGAPDFELSRGSLAVGYVEAKDIGKSLTEIEQGKGEDGKRFRRYLNALPNLILTDYLEFRWYVNAERRLSTRLGTPGTDGKVKRDKEGQARVAELLDRFLAYESPGVGDPRELALRLARLAHMVRDLIVAAFDREPEAGSLHGQLAAFRDNLIPDLTPAQFADMYAQTIAYGLFAARCASSEGKDFSRQNAAYLLPKTNPFLRKLFNHIAGPDLDDRIAWLVDDLAQLLARADMAAVLQDLGKRTAKEDPVVHFYETFLAAYDPQMREMRGVYYTPEPVVSYIVRSIDHLLKTRFGKSQGLADEKALILDPAVGTGTFLYDVVKVAHQAMQGQMGQWDGYVAERLLPRLFGFELLMAPYAIAHLKLGLLLQDTGYQFQSGQRLGVYLTNTLEEAFKKGEFAFAQYIVDEANEAAEIKKDKPIMVVLGNPPYSGISANASTRKERIEAGSQYKKRLGGKWVGVTAKRSLMATMPTFIGELLDDYYQVDGRPLGEKNPKWLQDDYVKFLRFGQWRIERTGQGVLGFITNHAYLDNPTFRGMRQSLINSFSEIYLLDLHGNARKKEVAPDGSPDENAFDIQQGVAIGIFVKEPGKPGPARVYHADLWGLREAKYQVLAETDVTATQWTELHPLSPFYFFVPHHEGLLAEYEQGWNLRDIFPVNSVGVVTGQDQNTISFTGKGACSLANGHGIPADRVKLILYRPFDLRFIVYDAKVVTRPRPEVMRHMLAGGNVGLIARRQMIGELMSYFFVSKHLISDGVIRSDNKGGESLFPLYLYPAEGEMGIQKGRRPNLNPEFVKALSGKLELKFVEDGRGDLEETFGSEDVFNYAYAVFHAPTYRSRYAEFLKIDFPRLPLTSDCQLFAALAAKGADLVALHLMESPVLSKLITKYDVPGSNVVEKVDYNEAAQRVYINKAQFFEGVPPEVWNFHIGGYQVCQKWLKDRKGRTLTIGDVEHYQKVVVALNETIRLMQEIDALIPSWPLE